MALTMKNYKGYNKLPYCTAHYPQTKATVVVDTPEQRRLQQTSQMQSQVAYHADFEKNIKGTMTSVAEDAETKRVKEMTGVVSQAAYARTSTSDNSEGYRREESHNTREQPRTYVPPQNPHGPSARMVMPTVPSQAPPPQPPPPTAPGGAVYVAMYDYDAQDDDEVSFMENDRIINSEKIDDGWIIGTVQRTGHRGMIPANYIEKN